MLLSLLGLRRGEVLGLRWTDIDLDAARLTIVENRISIAGVESVGSPKARASRHTLPLPPLVVDALRTLRTRQAREQLAAGEAYTSSGRVVVDEVGRPPRPELYSVKVDRAPILISRSSRISAWTPRPRPPMSEKFEASHRSVGYAVGCASQGHDDAILVRL